MSMLGGLWAKKMTVVHPLNSQICMRQLYGTCRVTNARQSADTFCRHLAQGPAQIRCIVLFVCSMADSFEEEQRQLSQLWKKARKDGCLSPWQQAKTYNHGAI